MAAALQLSWSSPHAVTPSKVHSVRQLRENRLGLMKNANRFRVLAYCAAARIAGDLPQEASTLIAAGKDLSELHGIGKDLAGKIGEIVQTGLAVLEDTERRIPDVYSSC